MLNGFNWSRQGWLAIQSILPLGKDPPSTNSPPNNLISKDTNADLSNLGKPTSIQKKIEITSAEKNFFEFAVFPSTLFQVVLHNWDDHIIQPQTILVPTEHNTNISPIWLKTLRSISSGINKCAPSQTTGRLGDS